MGGQNSGRHRSSKDAPQPNEGESRYAFWVRTMDPQAFAHHLLITAWSARRVGGKHVPRRVLGDPEEVSMTDAQIKAKVLADTAARNRWCDQDITIVKRATEEAVQAQPAMKRGTTTPTTKDINTRVERLVREHVTEIGQESAGKS